jgi:hypothetical protein
MYICPDNRMIKSRMMRWVRHVTHMGKIRKAYKILAGKPKVERPFGTYRCRLEHIKMNLREMGLEGVSWIHLAQDKDHWWAPVSMVMNLQVP